MKKKRIGLILASIHSGSANQVCSSLIKEASLFDTSFYIFPGGRLNAKANSEYLRNAVYNLANKKNIDGLISWASAIGGAVSLEELTDFHKKFEQVPFVTISQKIGGHSCVNFDAYSGMAELVNHFIKVHHITKIAFLRGPENHGSAADRYRAFCDTMKQAGISVENSPLISDPFEWRSGKEAIIQLCEKRRLVPGKDFSALLAASDIMAFDAIAYLQKKGFEVPDDYLAAGFNDVSKSRMLLSALTTVHMPYRTMGLNSYELILNEMNNSSRLKRNITLSAPLVIRESCGCTMSSLFVEKTKPEKLSSIEMARAKDNLILTLTKLFRLDMTNQNAIIEPVLNALWSKSTKLFFNLFSRAIKRFYESEMDVRTVFKAITILKNSPCIDSDYITSIEKDIFVILQQVSERYQEELRTMHEERSKILDSLKCVLISEHSVKEFLTALQTYLPQIGINSATTVLYEEKGSRFIGGFAKNKLFDEEQVFASEEILPSNVVSAFNNGIYLVQPIFADNKTFGHFICSVSFFDGLLFEDLRSVISSAFSGIFLFNELSAARKAAEQAEQAKTKFFATVGNELAAPLQEISKNTEELEQLLAQNQVLSGDIKQIVEKLKDNLGRQMERTNLIVDLTRSQSNEIHFDNHLFYPQELICSDSASQYVTTDFPIIYGDKARLKQAIGIYAKNFNFSVENCRLEKAENGMKILLPFSLAPQDSEIWNEPGILLANQIFLMQNCEFVKQEDHSELFINWPAFSCEEKALEISPENEAFIWNFEGKSENEIRAVYNQRTKDGFSQRAFICYDIENPENLEKNKDFCMLFERKLGIAQKPVLLVNCPEKIESKWNLPIPVTRADDIENITEIINKISPSIIILKEATLSVVSAIRNNLNSETVPVVVISEKLDQMPEIEKFFTVQKLILCNICVAASEEFGNRLRALLAGDAMLSPDTGGIVKKTILYFNKHGNEYISRWKLSEAVHTSEDYLTRVFHKETGLSPWEYLSLYRVNIACIQLRQTNESIFTIAEKSGFQDQAYFCRVFKKITGTTPGRYRKGLEKSFDKQ